MSTSNEKQIAQLDRELLQTDDPVEKARIYLRAGQLYSACAETDEACFFMTQALVFAAHNGNKTIEHEAREFLQKYDRI